MHTDKVIKMRIHLLVDLIVDPNLTRQISKVSNCGLRRVGSLNIDFIEGTCATANSKLVLCFPSSDKKLCYLTDQPFGSFTPIQNSNAEHVNVRIASSSGQK